MLPLFETYILGYSVRAHIWDAPFCYVLIAHSQMKYCFLFTLPLITINIVILFFPGDKLSPSVRAMHWHNENVCSARREHTWKNKYEYEYECACTSGQNGQVPNEEEESHKWIDLTQQLLWARTRNGRTGETGTLAFPSMNAYKLKMCDNFLIIYWAVWLRTARQPHPTKSVVTISFAGFSNGFRRILPFSVSQKLRIRNVIRLI